MLLPVIERFAELGWQPFADPGETFELFTVAGIFKRFDIDARLPTDSGAQQLVQRNALLDVCLGSGLAHLIVAYVHAASDGVSSGVVGKHYVLKDPIAVQQWLRRRVEALEKRVEGEIARYGEPLTPTPTDAKKRAHAHAATQSHSTLQDNAIRELSGLRAVAMALIERLKEGSRQLGANVRSVRVPTSSSDRPDVLLQQTELARLTSDGIQHLLELLFRIQAASLSCQCVLWLHERRLRVDADLWQEFYYQARTTRASLRQDFEGSYQVVLSSISNSDIAYPSLLIELVLQNANVAPQLSAPPRSLSELLTHLLRAPRIQDEISRFYGDELEHEPVESYFRVQVALLLYFALDLAYLHAVQSGRSAAMTATDLVGYLLDVADSFAAQMGVRDDMKATLVALWLVENATNVVVGRRAAASEGGDDDGDDDDEPATDARPLYQAAVTRLLESSAMHLQKASGLESDLILYMAETLVHRGESSFAWKIWTAFDLNLATLPAVATEYAVMVNLELGAWERALSVVRATRRLDLLPLVFKWLVRSARMRDFVHHTTLSPREERVFDDFMMAGRVVGRGDETLSDEAIRKADLLVMYYVLRNRFDEAWATHHEHLALLRETAAGDVHVAQSVLGRPSFQARAALLQNMRAEPVELASREYHFKRATAEPRAALPPSSSSGRVMNEADVLMLAGQDDQAGTAFSTMMDAESEDQDQDHDMTDAAMRPTAAAPVPSPTPKTPPRPTKPTDYSPGIFSSRSSHPRPASKPTDQPAFQRHGSWAGDVSTPARAPRPTVPIGSIDSSPDEPTPRRRHSLDSSAPQTLRFGILATPQRSGIAASGERRTQLLVTPPTRSRFNSSLSSLPAAARSSSDTDELSLRPRDEPIDATPVDVQVGVSGLSHAAPVSPVSASTAAVTTPPSTIAASASAVATASSSSTFETPKRFQFVREPPQTDSRLGARPQEPPLSPATQELEAMELEKIDEEFSTPSRPRPRRKEPSSAPVRRNPRRSSRTVY
ncbi:hypothetical protein P43SY_001407 [Pythium insidiosum]|uniref:ELYS-like domain-containing protein n=1 Tax=Pythium insidiosum TaxID=114742 RepID=A0AAD5Q7X5_PYTIN|nr:hypothetical protein P43SY_001407 [Pythium insidiosum]